MRAVEARDYAEIASWHEARGERPPPPDTLGALGFIEPGVCAAFARRTDSSVAFIDDAVTNPAASLRARRAAMLAIGERLVAELRAQGYRCVILTTQSEGVRRLVERHLGFKDRADFAMLGRAI